MFKKPLKQDKAEVYSSTHLATNYISHRGTVLCVKGERFTMRASLLKNTAFVRMWICFVTNESKSEKSQRDLRNFHILRNMPFDSVTEFDEEIHAPLNKKLKLAAD